MVQQEGATPVARLLIDGEWRTRGTGGIVDHVSPVTGRVQAEVPLGGRSEVQESVAAATAAAQSFGRSKPNERGEILMNISRLLQSRSADFVGALCAECGMLRRMAQAITQQAISWFAYYAGWTDKLTGDAVIDESGGLNYSLLEPYGVIAILYSWNGPLGSIGMKVAPALAAGSCVVLKPPELAPFSATLFGEVCIEAGLPDGVMNIVTGDAVAGDALVRHPDVDKISFTGGVPTARKIQMACAESLTPLVLELGGKSANIVFSDADLPRAMSTAVLGLSRLSGQVCHAPTRLLVQRDIYDAFTGEVADKLDSVVVGDPTSSASEMGPVISAEACARIMSTIEAAKEQGFGELRAGGSKLGGTLEGGFFIRPTAFGEVENSSPLAQEEVFGPVLAMMPFEDEDEAVALANDSRYGLAAHLHTSDLSRAHRVARSLRVGNVAVNGGKANGGPMGTFGGVKDSGFGREGGRHGVEEFLQVKNVNVNL
jgi:aldehyde dehydrogenase (NAD+)